MIAPQTPQNKEAEGRLKPIQIGPLTIDEPVLLAPMSGVSDLPFRRLVKGYGAGLVISENDRQPGHDLCQQAHHENGHDQ